MLIGYARVSTLDQNLNSQIEALNKIGCAKIYKEKISGAKTERKALTEAIEFMRIGDTLVVWRLDRLGRSLGKLIELMNVLKKRGISFKSIVETIDTSTSSGQFFFHITGAFAELERNLIRERTMAGLNSARSRRRYGGRPKVLDDKSFKMALCLYNERQCTVSNICERFHVSKRTFYRYLEKYREQQQSSLSKK